MSDLHIEGMGWLGSLTAWAAHEAGLRFTWSDFDAPSAWRASTGQAYPAGDDRSMADLATWRHWHAGDHPWAATGLTEEVDYWWTHKAPPHGGRYAVAADAGWARRAEPTAIQVDVQAVVESTRAAFGHRRRPASPGAERTVVAHGYGRRLGQFVWGWSAPVALGWPEELRGDRRPSLVIYEHRFSAGYAYPRPGTEEWWAGSAMVGQRATPRSRDAQAAAHRWATWVQERTPVTVEKVGAAREGWRPFPPKDDADGHLTVSEGGRRIEMPSLGASGIRWAPTVVAELRAVL